MAADRDNEPITVSLTRDQAWTVYDLLVAKAEAVEGAEMRAETGLGSGRYRRAATELRNVLDGAGSR